MDKILDIDQLIDENKRQESCKLNLFEERLVLCHKLIEKYNKARIREMIYTIPAFVFGRPKYDVDVLRNYLVWHLEDNGLKVQVIDRYNIYISWKETDIDIERYMNRKTLMENKYNDTYMLDRGPLSSHPRRKEREELLKFRQDRQRQLEAQKLERQQRFKMQKNRFPVNRPSNEF